MEQQIRGRTPKRLLDIGCGGGHVAYRMAPHAAEVIASDLSSEMIAAVVREAAQRDIGHIATVKAAAESLPFDSGHFEDRKSTRLNSRNQCASRMTSSS